MGFLGKPIDLAYRAVPESLKERISQALYHVLLQVRDHSRDTVRRQALYDQISQKVGLASLRGQDPRQLRSNVLDTTAQ